MDESKSFRKVYSIIGPSIIKILTAIIGLVVAINGIMGLLNNKQYNFDNILTVYFQMILFYIALPLFSLTNIAEALGFINDDSREYYHINFFYNAIYISMTIYAVSIYLENLFS